MRVEIPYKVERAGGSDICGSGAELVDAAEFSLEAYTRSRQETFAYEETAESIGVLSLRCSLAGKAHTPPPTPKKR